MIIKYKIDKNKIFFDQMAWCVVNFAGQSSTINLIQTAIKIVEFQKGISDQSSAPFEFSTGSVTLKTNNFLGKTIITNFKIQTLLFR